MTPSFLPPQNIWLSLPALTADEAEQLLHFVDELQRLLWEAYGDVLFDLAAEDEPPAAPDNDHGGDDDPDF